jgi:hypothetical protein
MSNNTSIIVTAVCSCVFIIGFFIMMVLGSHCIHTHEYDNCGTNDGAIALVIIGTIFFTSNIWILIGMISRFC